MKKEIEVIDEETWLARQGASRMDLGDPAIHRQPGGTPKSIAKNAQNQARKDHALIARRTELREQYEELVRVGEIRPPTRLERLAAIAKGHPDNPSVQAARRLLAKHTQSF